MKRELIWTWNGGNLCVLIPKRCGQGYLKVPYGHHLNPALEEVRSQLGDIDLVGLDGYLEFDLHFAGRKRNDEAFAAKALPLLEAHYGCPSRQSNTDFWRLNPNGSV